MGLVGIRRGRGRRRWICRRKDVSLMAKAAVEAGEGARKEEKINTAVRGAGQLGAPRRIRESMRLAWSESVALSDEAIVALLHGG